MRSVTATRTGPALALFCLLLCGPGPSGAATSRPAYAVPPVSAEPVLDGRLDDPLWLNALSLTLDYETAPGENIPPPVGTTCLITHTPDHLLVGFIAEDPAPGSIVANLADRDLPLDDDYVGILLDTFDDHHRGYAFMVTAGGVQIDLMRNEAGAEIEDLSWDAIWKSATARDTGGWSAEIAIPFDVLRYPDASGPMTWGLDALRFWPRHAEHEISLVPLDRDNPNLLEQTARITGFDGIGSGRDLEFNPTFISWRNDQRPPGGRMETRASEYDLGVSGHWGLTPNMSLDAALNPDFSQVEADELQLDVNTRYALQYQEKRPLFMEDADVFATPLQAIYTRTIFDPAWGLKLSGKSGATSIGAFLARDELTTLLLPAGGQLEDSRDRVIAGRQTPGVARCRFDLGGSSTLGGLATIREGDGYHNRVAGLDGRLRLTPSTRLDYQLLFSRTADVDTVRLQTGRVDGDFGGAAFSVAFAHESRDWTLDLGVSDMDAGFRADAGFVPRVDYRRYEGGLYRTWWGGPDRWFHNLGLGIAGLHVEDGRNRLAEREASLEGMYFGPRQSRVWLAAVGRREVYGGRTYDFGYGLGKVGMRPNGNLTLWLGFWSGNWIDYMNNRPAKRYGGGPGFNWKPTERIALETDIVHEYLEAAGRKLYRANIASTSLFYHFNRRAFLRTSIRYSYIDRDPANYLMPLPPTLAREQLFLQLLFSYKVNPRTVLFLGTTDNLQDPGTTPLILNDRTFFLKVGYAWRP